MRSLSSAHSLAHALALTQFLTSPRMVALFRAKGVEYEIPLVRRATKTYKHNATRAFTTLMRVFGL